ncbi:hypothetical protein Pint_10984 [Pistacia integerrima]|uniref:Uncharacterized protein n=1 Tax=Pistacia integerrima TaxID=434235 RepID=A0ACC0XJF8_9ROSI|nr:hypothetical protein Pint_10984 [Pistacia integerrima]
MNGGRLLWVPTEVNLDNHVIVPKLDPDDIDSPDKFVEDSISNLSKNKIKMSMPMWDLHLLNVKTSEAESVSVLRVHHSLGNRTSLMSLFLACTRKVSNPTEPPTIPMVKKVNSEKSSRGLKGKFIKLRLAMWLLWNTLVDVMMFLAMALMLIKDMKTPLKSPLGFGSSPRQFVHRSVSLDDIKLIKNSTRTIRESNKIDKGSSERSNNLPKSICLRATFFMNLRPIPGIQELADMMKKGTKAKWAKAAMDRKKASLEASFSYFLAKYFLKFGGLKMASFPSQTTLWFSNVAGPQEEISLFGHPVAYIAPSCFGQPNGLMIHVVSYANKMTFILSVDDDIIPDSHQLCDDLEVSLNRIKTAVIN